MFSRFFLLFFLFPMISYASSYTCHEKTGKRTYETNPSAYLSISAEMASLTVQLNGHSGATTLPSALIQLNTKPYLTIERNGLKRLNYLIESDESSRFLTLDADRNPNVNYVQTDSTGIVELMYSFKCFLN